MRVKSTLKRAVCLTLCATVFLSVAGCKKKTASTKKTKYSLEQAKSHMIYFGEFEQDSDTSNGAEPLCWQVIDQKDGKVLITTTELISTSLFSAEAGATSWDKSELRTWLNGEFYENAFDDEDKKYIIDTKLKNSKNPIYTSETKDGKDTKDKVFILSYSEAEKYFESAKDRMCNPTYSVLENGIAENKRNDTKARQWWLRTPGMNNERMCVVEGDGQLSVLGYDAGVSESNFGVRPFIWVKQELLDRGVTTEADAQ